MDESQQEHLDAQVSQALAELQAAGASVTAEGVRQRVGRRMADVLSAMKRVAGVGPSEPDLDLDPADYPTVVAAQARVDRLITALAEASQTVTEADAALTRAELAAADAVAEGRELPSLVDAGQRVVDAAERERLFGLALQVAKTRHAEALQEAQARHWQAQWQAYQAAVRAFDEALALAFAAQETARLAWNAIGQPGPPPMLKAPLSVWPDHFHAFLQQILDTEPSHVNRGVILTAGFPARPY